MNKTVSIIAVLLISIAACITCGCSQNSIQKNSNEEKAYKDCDSYNPGSSLSADRLRELQELPKGKLPAMAKPEPTPAYNAPAPATIDADDEENKSESFSNGKEQDRDLGDGADGERLKQVK